MSLYPVNLKIENRPCLVIGGGGVALRKVRSLLAAEARVRLVSPAILPELREVVNNNGVEWFARGYVEGDLKGMYLAFAATNDRGVQELIRREADKCGVLLNSADDPRGSHFHVPAHFRRGRMLITVSTEGGSPGLSKKIREQLEVEIVPGYGMVVDLLFMIRESIVGGAGDSTVNKELFSRLFAADIVELILQEDWFALQMLLLEELPEQVDAVSLLKGFLDAH